MIDPLQLVARISALEREVERLHALEGPLPRVGFQVSMSASQTDIAVGSWVTAQYDTVAWQYGSGFNAATYTFTAPVSGVYAMVATARLQQIDSTASRVEFRCVTSPRTFRDELSPIGFDQDINFWMMKVPFIVRMAASATAVCSIQQTGGLAQMDIVSGTGTRWMCWLIG
jgi:hypothetical protein